MEGALKGAPSYGLHPTPLYARASGVDANHVFGLAWDLASKEDQLTLAWEGLTPMFQGWSPEQVNRVSDTSICHG